MGKKAELKDTGHRVTIDSAFLREQASDAVRQFFRPITAPFEHAKSVSGQGTPKGNRRSAPRPKHAS